MKGIFQITLWTDNIRVPKIIKHQNFRVKNISREMKHFRNPEVIRSEQETVNKADLLRYEVMLHRMPFVSYI